ncbi:hypothetical protein FB567DRAFT_602539 [Paraphoma chrysanthemicola]|uniref:Uncharacterized protein n=1 Tax=Paraphoma chrysanthemicola TaxID=798071 RepID=A0A8K0R7T7_9PLEO|nr:hypothetical protein FB567DRAFT_602539 [Paraphoma chrysanthemicola]
MRSLIYLLPWFLLSHLSWSLTIPPSINVHKRALTGDNFVDEVGTSSPPDEEDLFWRQELEESIQVVRLLAQNALRVPQSSFVAALYFGGSQFYDLRTRIFNAIIHIIDNPPPHFRLVRAQRVAGLPATTAAQVYYGRWVEGTYPELTGEARRAAFVHLASWMLDINLQDEGFSPDFIQLLYATHGGAHPNNNQQDDQTRPTYPEQPDIARNTDITGQIIEDLVPENFLTNQGDDPFLSTLLDELARPGRPRPVAYDIRRVEIVPSMHHGQMIAAMNAQNYAAFAVVAYRNQLVEPVDYNDMDGDIQDAIDFADGVGVPQDPSIRAGEGWPDLNPDLQNVGVRYMLAATEVWLDYDQLGSDFLKKGQ